MEVRAVRGRFSIPIALSALLTAGLAGCGEISTAPLGLYYRQPVAYGTYDLVTVNGRFLPYAYDRYGSTVVLQGDTYTLGSDHTYVESVDQIVYDAYGARRLPYREYGYWSQDNNAVTFTPDPYSGRGGYSYTGSLGTAGYSGRGVSLTIALNGTVSVYAVR